MADNGAQSPGSIFQPDSADIRHLSLPFDATDSERAYAMKTAAALYYLALRDLPALVEYTHSLQESAALNSRNSSKLPSDGYAKPKPKSSRGKSGEKKQVVSQVTPGPRSNWSKHLTRPKFIRPCGCGIDLSGQSDLVYESLMVFDLPLQKLVVTEHLVEV
jgi:hypothetical protein